MSHCCNSVMLGYMTVSVRRMLANCYRHLAFTTVYACICYYRHVPVPCSCLFPLRLRLVKGHFSGAFASSRSDLEFGMCYCYSVFGLSSHQIFRYV